MIDFKVRCYHNDNEGKVIGAEVIIYSGDDVIDNIVLVDKTKFDELSEQLGELNTTYVDNNELKEYLENSNESNIINATTLSGFASDKFLKTDDINAYQFSPGPHSSSSPVYGAGSTSDYGHVKLVDNCNHDSYHDGEALSARQGYELDSRLTDLEGNVKKNNVRILLSRKSDGAGETGTQIIMGYNTGNGIVARIDCDEQDYDLNGRTIRLLINGVMYDRITDGQGKTSAVTINLSPGTYLVTALMAGYDGKNPVSEQKFLVVENNG